MSQESNAGVFHRIGAPVFLHRRTRQPEWTTSSTQRGQVSVVASVEEEKPKPDIIEVAIIGRPKRRQITRC